MKVRKRDICIINCSPSLGHEQRGIRPVVVVSGNALQDGMGIAIVCLMTSKIRNYPGTVTLAACDSNGLDTDSQVLAFQIRTIDLCRVQTVLGQVSHKQMKEIETKISEVCTF